MAKLKFPVTMFQVTASLNIKEIVLVAKAMVSGWRSEYERAGYAQDAAGKQYYVHPLFETRAAALAAAEKMLAEQEVRLKKSTENLAKRRANLEKARSGKVAKPAKSA